MWPQVTRMHSVSENINMRKVSCLNIDLYMQKLFAGERYDYKKANSMNNTYLILSLYRMFVISIWAIIFRARLTYAIRDVT